MPVIGSDLFQLEHRDVWVSRGGWDGQVRKSCVCPAKELELFPAGDRATMKAFMPENDKIRL